MLSLYVESYNDSTAVKQIIYRAGCFTFNYLMKGLNKFGPVKEK
jgi:hypothetical protein